MTFFDWLEGSGVAVLMRQLPLLYPVIEIIHILGIVFVVGSAMLFDLRLLGVAKKIPVSSLAKLLLTWSRRGLWLVIPSGLLLFSSDAVSLIQNPVFISKLFLILLAFGNAVFFHFSTYRNHKDWEGGRKAKGAAIISMILWISIISCGRLIAYF